MVFLGASLAAETKTAPSDLKCAAVNDVVNDLQAKIPDVEIDFLDQLHALMFLSGLKDLAKAEVQTPPMAITGAMLVHAPGDKGVVLGILVGKTICEYTAMPIELAIAVLKHGTES